MNTVKFRGQIVMDGDVKPLTISISNPVYDSQDYGSYYCFVLVEPRLAKGFRICGEDAAQAHVLARSFVLDVTSNYEIRDIQGRVVRLTAESLK